jgi:hypothetical protein
MLNLIHKRCYNHPQREAVVRCLDCQQFFCRECATEHNDRMMCSQCLARLADVHPERSGRWLNVALLCAQGIFGFTILWYAFYLVGHMLLTIPHSFHEGTIWEAGRWLPK